MAAVRPPLRPTPTPPFQGGAKRAEGKALPTRRGWGGDGRRGALATATYPKPSLAERGLSGLTASPSPMGRGWGGDGGRGALATATYPKTLPFKEGLNAPKPTRSARNGRWGNPRSAAARSAPPPPRAPSPPPDPRPDRRARASWCGWRRDR